MGKRVVGAIILIIVAIAVYQLLFGRLFPWSPIKLGYQEQEFSRAVVILRYGGSLPEELQGLDRIFREIEESHRLEFRKKVEVILPTTQEGYRRYGGRGLGCALLTGTVVLLSPEVERRGRSPRDLLRHELSHALLYQHTTLLKAFQIPDWFREGLAIYYGNPNDYYTTGEFSGLAIEEGYPLDVITAKDRLEGIPEGDRYKFLYSAYLYFFHYLIEEYGAEKLLDYMNRVIEEPRLERPLFLQAFGAELQAVADSFKQDVLERKMAGQPPDASVKQGSAR